MVVNTGSVGGYKIHIHPVHIVDGCDSQALCKRVCCLLQRCPSTGLLASSWQIKYKAHVQKTRNDYKLVTDTPVYVQAVKSGKQLSDVSLPWGSDFG